jgi:hypothetical protein
MWMLACLVGFSLGAWIGTKYSVIILLAALAVGDISLLATGLAAGWSTLHIVLVLAAATTALQSGYFASLLHSNGLMNSWRFLALGLVAGGCARR